MDAIDLLSCHGSSASPGINPNYAWKITGMLFTILEGSIWVVDLWIYQYHHDFRHD
jgi:hypothetical protein